ncbi:hypothetical protein JOB18_006663 [Solea senegalensis]|uniref:Uncharacterized protein n=1 Tax=Solea senegalensis TaxID=28829 RepID=A0AAV6QUU9_SOLSE|nr:hypothetical protein JOB18_006663 [Solea senegalensis]
MTQDLFLVLMTEVREGRVCERHTADLTEEERGAVGSAVCDRAIHRELHLTFSSSSRWLLPVTMLPGRGEVTSLLGCGPFAAKLRVAMTT